MGQGPEAVISAPIGGRCQGNTARELAPAWI